MTSPSRVPRFTAALSVLAIPLNVVVWVWLVFDKTHVDDAGRLVLFTFIALLQLAFGLTAAISGIVKKRYAPAVIGALAVAGAVVGWVLGVAALAVAAGAGAVH